MFLLKLYLSRAWVGSIMIGAPETGSIFLTLVWSYSRSPCRYLDCCVESLQEYGGPRLDKEAPFSRSPDIGATSSAIVAKFYQALGRACFCRAHTATLLVPCATPSVPTATLSQQLVVWSLEAPDNTNKARKERGSDTSVYYQRGLLERLDCHTRRFKQPHILPRHTI